MKTHKNLFKKAFNFQNMIASYKKARKGHSKSLEVAEFDYNLEHNIFNLLKEIKSNKYKTGKYKQFVVHDPKERVIKAVPFKDRVVHHAIYSVLEPIYEKIFIYDSYACRKGKGIHFGLNRLKKLIQKQNHKKYALNCDVKKYFPSIDQNILKSILKKKISDKKFLKIIFEIIDSESSFKGKDKGIPIGNLTSQLFANIYLHELDMYAKHILKIKSYFRYVDDFLILSNNKFKLKQLNKQITHYLKHNLKLELPYYKSNIFLIRDGVDFVGYKIFPEKVKVRKSNYKRLLKRLKAIKHLPKKDKAIKSQYISWYGYSKHADAHKLTKQTFGFNIMN